MKQHGALLGAFVFGFVVASALAAMIVFMRDRDGDAEVDLNDDLLLDLLRSPIACPTLGHPAGSPTSMQRTMVSSVAVEIPSGYTFQGARPSSPPTVSDGASYIRIEGGAADLEVRVYPNVQAYPVPNLDGSLRSAHDLNDVLRNQFDSSNFLIFRDCDIVRETRTDDTGLDQIGSLKRGGTDGGVDQRGFIHLRDGRFISISMYGGPIDEQEATFEAIVASVAELN